MIVSSSGYANSTDVFPVYIGDDRTDEDAFKVYIILYSSIVFVSLTNNSILSPNLNYSEQFGTYVNAKLTGSKKQGARAWDSCF